MDGKLFEKILLIVIVGWLAAKFVNPILDNTIGKALGLPAGR
jgi:hypothetical protein